MKMLWFLREIEIYYVGNGIIAATKKVLLNDTTKTPEPVMMRKHPVCKEKKAEVHEIMVEDWVKVNPPIPTSAIDYDYQQPLQLWLQHNWIRVAPDYTITKAEKLYHDEMLNI